MLGRAQLLAEVEERLGDVAGRFAIVGAPPAPQPAPSDTPGAIGPDPTGGGTTTPVGGTDSTGSNTPVGTGNHGHGGRNPSGGDKPAGGTSVPATQNPTATAETTVV